MKGTLNRELRVSSFFFKIILCPPEPSQSITGPTELKLSALKKKNKTKNPHSLVMQAKTIIPKKSPIGTLNLGNPKNA